MANQPTTKQLQAAIRDLEETSKMLVRRDLDLRAAYENLKSLETQKSDFVAIAAHQLRTPLTTIQWALRAIEDGGAVSLTSDQTEALQQAFASTAHMHTLVENLITVNKVEYGGLKLHRQVSSVNKIITDCVRSLTAQAEEHKVLLETYLDTDLCPVNLDAKLLREAVKNLLNNAINYSIAGERVLLQTTSKAGKVYITITDIGVGVEEGAEEVIFKKFTRLPSAERIDANGSGLGLYIARQIIVQHGGSLSFAHNQPTGSIFTVALPCYNQNTL